MFAFISLFLCLSVLLTFTSAQAPPAGPFTIGAYNPDIWGVAGIAANGGLFWIGKDTASYCPAVDGIDCDDYPGDSTVLAGGNDTLSLDVVVPGGQQVYVGPDGALGYTLPHSVYMPNGSVTTGFLRFQSFAGGAPVPMTFQGESFLGCPAVNETGVYQVFATTLAASSDGCTFFGIRTYSADGVDAFEYE